jgi:NIMA (never in mitosis gene a)-related kinase
MSLNDFEIERKLGEGAYSSVYLVRRMQDKMQYALKKVKIMNLSEKEKENALNEIRILASIEHPNIVQYKEAFVDEQVNQLCIIMDYNDDGDLYQRIVEQQKRSQLIKEEDIWSIFIQVTQGLK